MPAITFSADEKKLYVLEWIKVFHIWTLLNSSEQKAFELFTELEPDSWKKRPLKWLIGWSTCTLAFGCWITWLISSWANSQNDNYCHLKWQPGTILSENSEFCECAQLSELLFLSQLETNHSQQPETRGYADHLHSCNFMIPAPLFYEVNDPLPQVCYKP